MEGKVARFSIFQLCNRLLFRGRSEAVTEDEGGDEKVLRELPSVTVRPNYRG